MKKLTKVLLILGVGLCLIGAIFVGLGRLNGGDTAFRDAAIAVNSVRTGVTNGEPHTYEKSKMPLDSFKLIDAELANMDLSIKASDDNQARLSYHIQGTTLESPLHVSVKDGVLHLTESQALASTGYSRTVIGLPFLSDFFTIDDEIQSQVTLYLPKTTYDALTLKMNLGNLDIENADFASADIGIDYGDCHLQNASFKNAAFAMNNGDMACKNTTLDASTATLDLGDFSSDDARFAGDVSLSVDLGDLSIKLSEDMFPLLSIDAATRAGSMEISDKLTGGSLSDGDGDTTTSFHRTLIDEDVAHLDIESNMGDITIR
ncbi:MAG: DUF4097 family beta strand repeat-containing protein [Peptococcaceae bacterium]|nr:DUF4097 family beta strand repeat-containing protein [Peptococcaceae bacterium]